MRSYGIPCKMVRVIADLYESFECAVIDIRLVRDQVRSKAAMCDVRILVLTGPGLDHEEGNSRQEKRDTMKFLNSAGGP